ncbi:MAG: hypothetical protein ABI067_07070 [Leifsonia sp.]
MNGTTYNEQFLALHTWIMYNREIYHLLKINIIDEKQLQLHDKHYIPIMKVQLNLDKAIERKRIAIKAYLEANDNGGSVDDKNKILTFIQETNEVIKKLMLYII